MHDEIEKILFDETALKKAVDEIGKAITNDYSADNPPLLVGILKGSVVFMADLMRAIDIPCEIDFMVAQSYGNSSISPGNVQIKQDLTTDIANRHVIIVEDILDSARTIYSIIETLKVRKPASIKICTLLDKKVTRAFPLKADYKCFDIENQFVVGYGLDYAQKFRNLPYIGILKPEFIKSNNH